MSEIFRSPEKYLQEFLCFSIYSTLLETAAGNPSETKTWVSEYNFPAMLSRCKFPKEYDAIHELQTNK